MNGFSSVLGFICIALIDIILWSMLLRAILSLFTDGGVILNFVYSITEPIIIPVRKLLEKFNISSVLPIDLAFLITYLLLSVLSTVLGIWF